MGCARRSDRLHLLDRTEGRGTRPFWRGASRTGPSPCAGWWPNSPRAALRSIIDRCGILFTPRSSASKKTVVASERDRPDVARRRAQWTKRQSGIDPKRLVFIDETWTKTNMEPLRGWAPRGERLVAKVPHGHWKTMTFVASLRHDRIEAPWLIDGPINGEGFRTYVEKVLAPTLRPDELVMMDNLGSHKGKAVRPGHSLSRREAVLSPQILARSQSDRTGLRQAQAPSAQGGGAKPRSRRRRHRRTARRLHRARVRQLLCTTPATDKPEIHPALGGR